MKFLSNSYVHVPLDKQGDLGPVLAEGGGVRNEEPPRYTLKVHVGKRLEPWVESVERLKE